MLLTLFILTVYLIRCVSGQQKWHRLIEYVSYLNSRYGGQNGWKQSSRLETALRQLADRCFILREEATDSKEKNKMLLELVDAKRSIHISQDKCA